MVLTCIFFVKHKNPLKIEINLKLKISITIARNDSEMLFLEINICVTGARILKFKLYRVPTKFVLLSFFSDAIVFDVN